MKLTGFAVALVAIAAACSKSENNQPAAAATESKSAPAAAPAAAPSPAPIDAAAVTDAAVADAEPAITVTAERLAADFKANKSAALKKYQGKPLVVTGKVIRVGENDLGPVPNIAELATASGAMQVNGEGEAPLPLKAGDNATLRCTWDGMDFGPPLLSGCTVVK